jgi:di/tricarboxylate transporter
MTPELTIVLILLATAIAMFAVGRPRMDAVALIMLALLPLLGVISMDEALRGFSDPTVVFIATLFVIGEGLARTGVARRLGDWLIAKAGSNDTLLLVLLMVVVGALGSVMSSTAVTAIFIPVALRIAQITGTAPNRLMMPLSFAALISGMLTLVATAPNLVVNSELLRHGENGFSFFSFTPFGLPILIVGMVYMVFARRWLPGLQSHIPARVTPRPNLADWIAEYKLTGRARQYRVPAVSPLAGKTLEEIRLRDTSGASLVAIERDRKLVQPTAKTELRAGDVLLVDLLGVEANTELLHEKYVLECMALNGSYLTDRAQDIGMAEVILPAGSDVVGMTVAEAAFRDRYGLTVIGLRRGGVAHERDLKNEALRLGDTLLVVGLWKAIRRAKSQGRDLVVLNMPAEFDEVLPVGAKAPHAIFCLALVVVLMVTGIVPNVQAALIGCLLMGVFGVIDMTSAYRSIDWKTIVLIVGMLPFSVALERTGGVDLLADGLITVTGGAGTYGVLASLFVMTALLGMFMSNTATAVLKAPVALAVAKHLHASPYPFAMIVALAASTAFMTPVSSPVNTLVVTPGDLTFGDFVRIGVPFSMIVMLLAVFMVPWLLPL